MREIHLNEDQEIGSLMQAIKDEMPRGSCFMTGYDPDRTEQERAYVTDEIGNIIAAGGDSCSIYRALHACYYSLLAAKKKGKG